MAKIKKMPVPSRKKAAQKTGKTPGTTKKAPDSGPEAAADETARPEPDPTRYGDWQVKGRCIDF